MTRILWLAVFCLAAQSALSPAPLSASTAQTPQALAARERAEQAISDERWCDAAHEFIRAYEMSSPTVREALLNAAVAARRADDLEFAAALYERFVNAHPVHRHRSTAERLAGELREQIQREGPGSTCPPAPPLPEIGPAAIVVRADAPGAVVFVDDMVVGEAPVSVQPPSMEPITLKVEASGRVPFVARVAPSMEEVVVEARLTLMPPEPEKPPDDIEVTATPPDPPPPSAEPEGPETAVTAEPSDDASEPVVIVIRETAPIPPEVVTFETPPPPNGASRGSGRLGTYGWALVGSGAAIAGGGGGFVWSAHRTAGELSSYLPTPGEAPGREFDSELQGLEQRYETHRLLGGGGLIGGGVLAGLGLILVIMDGAN